MFYIYKYTHNDTARAYIGKTNNMRARMCQHRCSVNKGSNFHFHNALRKYGEYSFKCTILWEGECEEGAYAREIELIAEHDTYHNGFNMSVGGDSGPDLTGRLHTNETKRKISLSNTGVSRGLGMSKSISHRSNIGKAHIGKPKNYKNGRTKEWSIKQPDGSILVIENLYQYEKSLGLACNAIRNTIKTLKPHYSGYQVILGV